MTTSILDYLQQLDRENLAYTNKNSFSGITKHYCIKNIDFSTFDINATNAVGDNALLFLFQSSENDYHWNISPEQIDYLIFNSDLLQQNTIGYNALLVCVLNNKRMQLNLNEKQWTYLIEHSNLKAHTQGGRDILQSLNTFWHIEDIDLTSEQYLKIIERSDLNLINVAGKSAFISFINETAQFLRTQHWQLLTQKVLNKNNETNIPKHNSLIFHLGENYSSFSKVWPHIEDKNWFLNYIKSSTYTHQVDKIYNTLEVLSYLERACMQKNVSQGSEVGAFIRKI